MRILIVFQIITRLDDLLNAVIGVSIDLIFIVLIVKGVRWAKWVLPFWLGIYGLAYIITASYEEIPILYAYGVFDIFFGIIIHWTHFEKRPTSMEDKINYHYPKLVKRIKATFIDSMLILFALVAVMLLVGESEGRPTIMIISALILIFLYEPLLTSYSQTLGQRLMNLKVVTFGQSNRKLNIAQAYIRWISKVLLGWLSFITINFDKDRRAIHDIASDSVMVEFKTSPHAIVQA